MRRTVPLLVLASLCLAFAASPARGGTPVTVEFMGYQQLNGRMLFQIHVDHIAPESEPPLMMTGYRLNFAPYQVGAFHQATQSGVDPATGQKITIDVSTLELIDIYTGEKVELPFRRQIQLKAGPEMKQTRGGVGAPGPSPA
jgi:hypothetical protein